MQKMLGGILIVLAGLVGMMPAGAGATTLQLPIVTPLCLSTNAPAACNGGVVSVADYSFTFDFSDVTDGGGIITAASLTLDLFDDFGQADGSDKLDLFLDLVDMQVNGDTQNDLVLPLVDLSPLDDGFLHVWIRPDAGDFFLGGGSLTLTVETRAEDLGPGTSAVPVPPSAALLGLGLIALAVRRRA